MIGRPMLPTLAVATLLSMSGSAWAGPPPPPPEPAGEAPSEAARLSAPPPPSTSSPTTTTPADPLVIDQRTPDTDLGTNWSFSRSSELGPNYVREADEDPFFSVNPIGYYQGVSVGSGNLPPYAPKEVGGSSAVLTWTGFERGEASSRVFFQLSASVEPEVAVEANRVTIKLPRTSVTVRNNQRSLITKYFNTPVTEVKVKRARKDLLVTLDLRWESTPQWRFEAGANGYQVLVFEFPDVVDANAGSQAPPPPPPQPTPPG